MFCRSDRAAWSVVTCCSSSTRGFSSVLGPGRVLELWFGASWRSRLGRWCNSGVQESRRCRLAVYVWRQTANDLDCEQDLKRWQADWIAVVDLYHPPMCTQISWRQKACSWTNCTGLGKALHFLHQVRFGGLYSRRKAEQVHQSSASDTNTSDDEELQTTPPQQRQSISPNVAAALAFCPPTNDSEPVPAYPRNSDREHGLGNMHEYFVWCFFLSSAVLFNIMLLQTH